MIFTNAVVMEDTRSIYLQGAIPETIAIPSSIIEIFTFNAITVESIKEKKQLISQDG